MNLKKILAPVQEWIISQGKCPGCGRGLVSGRKMERKDNAKTVICQCSRIFIFDKRNGKYHRATFSEAKND